MVAMSERVVSCTKNLRIVDYTRKEGDKFVSFEMPKNFTGLVPAWVIKHPFFQLALDDKTCFFPGDIKQVSAVDVAKLAEAEAIKAREEKYKTDIGNAKKEAKAETEKLALVKGWDETTKKAEIKKAQEAAVEAVKKAYADEKAAELDTEDKDSE